MFKTILLFIIFTGTLLGIYGEVLEFIKDKTSYSIVNKNNNKIRIPTLAILVFVTPLLRTQLLMSLVYIIVFILVLVTTNILNLLSYHITKNSRSIIILILFDILSICVIYSAVSRLVNNIAY